MGGLASSQGRKLPFFLARIDGFLLTGLIKRDPDAN